MFGRLLCRLGRHDYRVLTITSDPLTMAVNRAFNTGETVVWNAGDPLLDPEGPVREVAAGWRCARCGAYRTGLGA